MKNRIALWFAVMGISATYAQETEANADFSLEGALAVFKKSASPEAFEKALNEESSNVNNLDLNNDEKTDYISVEDIREGDTHVLVLSTFVGDNEKQDIATIGIEKTGTDSAVLQIEGDESLFPENTIVEPADKATTDIQSKGGPAEPELALKSVVVNVWLWPAVRFLYAPAYVVYVSPYRWAYYPGWWRPWRPVARAVFYTRTAPHRIYYHPVATRRVVAARRVYAPKRHASALVVRNGRGTTVVHKNPKGKVKAVRVHKTPRATRVRVRR